MASAKLERLMNLVAALLHTRVPLSAETIRRRVGGYTGNDVAFHRQFSRDKEDLREMGIPIRVELVPDASDPVEGYRIDPDEYYLPDPGLGADELAALHLATRLVSVPAQPGSSGLFKLGGLTGAGDPAGPPRAEVSTLPGLGTFFDAIGSGRVVEFVHRDRRRRLAPRLLGFQQGNWYVSGWDLGADGERVYRIDRIEGEVVPTAEVVPEHLDTRARLAPLEPWNVGDEEPIAVKIRVDAISRPSIVARFGVEAERQVAADGSSVFAFDVLNADGFITWILGYSDTVEILEPHELRTALIDRLEQLVGEPS